jgi:lysozyme
VNIEPGVSLAKRFEGFVPHPYPDPGSGGEPWTIGYGSTYYADGRRVRPTDPPITQAEAEALLRHELLTTYLPGVRRLCPGLYALALLEADTRRVCAICDFAYNAGLGRLQASTLRRALEAQDWEWAKREIMRWVRASGRVMPGLVRRREAESALL